MHQERVLTRSEAALRSSRLKSAGLRVVFTNGCFDLLHRGHIHVLDKSRALGDVLFVGLNTDESIRRLKGQARPLNELADRAAVLASLRPVDFVVPFDEDTPLELIRVILPDVLVKGGDYNHETVVGAEAVTRNGGSVEIVDLLPGYSTTSLIRTLSGNAGK